MIFGVVGRYGSGKDTVAALLEEFGFSHFSLSDELRRELKKKGIDESREALITIGNGLRKRYGNGVLAKRALQQIIKGENAIITSIRNLGELDELRKISEFRLIFVDASPELRYARLQNRLRTGDIQNFEQFLALEKKESSGKNHEQQLDAIIDRADIVVLNIEDIVSLKSKLKKILVDHGLKAKYKRPTWDEYFIEVMDAISKRATCDRGRSGCVIARNKQLLSTGYVGSPIGLPHCDEVGHQMKRMIHEDGTVTEHCVRTVHAEQNAISQAAKLGVSLDGSTLYCRMVPCRVCAMIIINCGIKRVVSQKRYQAGSESETMFKTAKIILEILNLEVQKYEK